MANENVSEPGGSNNPPDNGTTDDGAAPEGDAPSPGREGDTRTREERAVNDDEARERERVDTQAAQLQAVRRMGVPDTTRTGTGFTVAATDFDPKEAEPQLAEHWVHSDPEWEDHGYL